MAHPANIKLAMVIITASPETLDNLKLNFPNITEYYRPGIFR